MNKEELLEFLRENLTVDVDFKSGSGYWDSNRVVVRLLLDGEEFSESSVSLPSWIEKESSY